MQLTSALLTASGALGLAFRYRKVLFQRTSRGAKNRLGNLDADSLDGGRHPEATNQPKTTPKELVI